MFPESSRRRGQRCPRRSEGDTVTAVRSPPRSRSSSNSGTTGTPKGVMLDHANLVAMVEMIRRIAARPRDRCLLILPLFHVNGIVVSVLSPLAAGGATSIRHGFRLHVLRHRPGPAADVLLRGTLDLRNAERTARRRCARHVVDRVRGLRRRSHAGRKDRPLRGALRHPDRRRLRALGVHVCSHPQSHRDPASPAPSAAAARSRRCVPRRRRPTDANGTGEVVVRGPNVMRGYLKQPDETTSTLHDGWLHTGDVGSFDDDGYLVLVDRVKDMIIRGGENIYPKEIENVLYRHPPCSKPRSSGGRTTCWARSRSRSSRSRRLAERSRGTEVPLRHLTCRYKNPARSSSSMLSPRTRSARSPSPTSRHAAHERSGLTTSGCQRF